MTQAKGHINGQNDQHQIAFYGISTCIWCRKTRHFLEENSVTFDFTYVDLLDPQEMKSIKEIVRRWNPSVSFPTTVIDNEQCVIGYKPDTLKEILEL